MEPKQGGDKGSRRLFFILVAITVILLAAFLILRPRGSESGPPQRSTQQ